MKCVLIILNYLDKNRSLNLAEKCSQFSTIDHVVIVDNCSPDDSFEFLRKNQSAKISVIQSDRNGGFSYGNNIGARYALNNFHPEYILFANPDTIFEESNVLACLNFLKSHNDIGLVSTRMKNINGKEEISCWKHKTYIQMVLFCLKMYRSTNYMKFYYNFDNVKDEWIYVDVVRGSFMFFNAKAFELANYFDGNTFLYYEEDIVAKRLNNAGFNIALLTNYFYIHDHIYSKSINTLVTKDRLDSSMYYYLVNYYNISFVKRVLAKIIIAYSKFEEYIIVKIKKLK